MCVTWNKYEIEIIQCSIKLAQNTYFLNTILLEYPKQIFNIILITSKSLKCSFLPEILSSQNCLEGVPVYNWINFTLTHSPVSGRWSIHWFDVAIATLQHGNMPAKLYWLSPSVWQITSYEPTVLCLPSSEPFYTHSLSQTLKKEI